MLDIVNPMLTWGDVQSQEFPFLSFSPLEFSPCPQICSKGHPRIWDVACGARGLSVSSVYSGGSKSLPDTMCKPES